MGVKEPRKPRGVRLRPSVTGVIALALTPFMINDCRIEKPDTEI
jgi:hypothetical protein